MCASMVDIQSATAEIRREKKQERRRKRKRDKNIMFASATQGGHKKRNIIDSIVNKSGSPRPTSVELKISGK